MQEASAASQIIKRAYYGNYTYRCPANLIQKYVTMTAENDPTQTTVQRVSQELQWSAGGKTQFGYSKAVVNYLGRTEGQPGGGGQPPRNKF